MKEIEQKIYNSVASVIENLGYELVEVKFEEQEDINITFVIHNNKGITFDDCKIVTENISEILDELNPTNNNPYNLNVSSLGLDRPIKTKRDFERYINKKIELNLIDNQKVVGTVVDVNEKLTLNIKGKNKLIDYGDIILAKAYIKF